MNSEFQYPAELVAHHQKAVAPAGQLQRAELPELRAFGQSIVKPRPPRSTR